MGSNRNRDKGNDYERQVAKELRELGFPGVVTSRSESKSTDDDKVDLIDKEGKLPVNIQLKKTKNTPAYFDIRAQSSVDPETFVLFGNKQEKKKINFCSAGELVMMDKSLFYKMLTKYIK